MIGSGGEVRRRDLNLVANKCEAFQPFSEASAAAGVQYPSHSKGSQVVWWVLGSNRTGQDRLGQDNRTVVRIG